MAYCSLSLVNPANCDVFKFHLDLSKKKHFKYNVTREMSPQVKCNFVHGLLKRKFWIVSSVKGYTEVERNIQPRYATTATHLYFIIISAAYCQTYYLIKSILFLSSKTSTIHLTMPNCPSILNAPDLFTEKLIGDHKMQWDRNTFEVPDQYFDQIPSKHYFLYNKAFFFFLLKGN